MQVNKDELIRQMQAVAHHLTENEDAKELGEMIHTWALAVEELYEEEYDCEEYTDLKNAIEGALKDAKAHNPITP